MQINPEPLTLMPYPWEDLLISQPLDTSRESSLEQLLAEFCGRNEARAARAFEVLAVRTRRFLDSYLRGKLHSEEAREDVIQEVIQQLWSRRGQFENRGTAGWWTFAKLAADRRRVDWVRKIGQEVHWDDADVGEIPSQDITTVETLLGLSEEIESLYEAANELWLGTDASTPISERARRVLAADLFYLQGLSWEEVCGVLNRNRAHPSLTRPLFDVWVSSPATVLNLAFRLPVPR